MPKNYCENCPYYKGKTVSSEGEQKIVEQCGKKYWEENDLSHEIKYGSSEDVLCVVEQDYHYYLTVLVGEYKRLENIQITEQEYRTFELWKDDREKINMLVERKLGCRHCRHAAIIKQPKQCMKFLKTNYEIQSDLWCCQFCGTYWEYGVYNCSIVDKSYVSHYFQIE